MDRFVIEGGVPLCGEVEVNGAKNAVLPIMAATLLAHDVFTIKNIPLVRDVYTMKKVLEVLGCRIEIDEAGHVMIIDTRERKGWEAPYELVKQMRASYYVLGSLMGKDKRARVVGKENGVEKTLCLPPFVSSDVRHVRFSHAREPQNF